MKKILIRVYLVLLSLCIISLIVLSVLGSKSRVGYLEISSFNENDSYSNNYIYSFQVKYYDKIFRNSDIYGVYLVTNSLPEYIKEIKMNDNLGTPFGSLVSSKEIIENKVDNVKYILKIKSKIINYSIIFFLLFAILLILNIEKLYLIYFSSLNKRYIYIIVVFLCFLILPKIIYVCFYEYFDHENYENRNFAKYPDINANFFNYPKMYEEYCEDNGRTPHGKSRFWEYMADKGFVIKRYSDGAYYFKDTTVQESDFEAIDDTIANPFEQMDLSLA